MGEGDDEDGVSDLDRIDVETDDPHKTSLNEEGCSRTHPEDGRVQEESADDEGDVRGVSSSSRGRTLRQQRGGGRRRGKSTLHSQQSVRAAEEGDGGAAADRGGHTPSQVGATKQGLSPVKQSPQDRALLEDAAKFLPATAERRRKRKVRYGEDAA
ncbi:hypothetical protein NMY22_g18126 [Coprinellus aureogranulatus]|nr:hypothetical protein NMY22_g18126 [Coprinellus aureogranulatus]